MAEIMKNMQSTSLRSLTQATDSTRNGWSPKNNAPAMAASTVLRQRGAPTSAAPALKVPAILKRSANRKQARNTLQLWMTMLVR